MLKSQPRRVGFWKSSEEPCLPMPEANAEPFPGKSGLLEALRNAQVLAVENAYRGWSTCRICSKPNGNRKYTLGRWVWPSGYLHYLDAHNVEPDPEFAAYLLQK